LLGLLILALAPVARADINLKDIKPDGFSRGVVFTVDKYTGMEALMGFPVLVRISETGISGFKYSDMMFPATGDDIAFVAADGAALAYDIDTWNPNGTSLVWVRIPLMENKTQFAMYYRSSKSGKDLNAGSPFAGYAGVWHLNESGSGSANTAIGDASGNNLSGLAVGTAQSVAAGKIGGSWKINSEYNRVNTGISIDLSADAKEAVVKALGSTFHESFWFKQSGDNKWCVTGVNRRPDGSTAGWGVQFGNNRSQLRVYGNGGKNIFATGNFSVNIANDVWHKVDTVWDADGATGKYILYFNGAQVATGDLNPTAAVKQPAGVNLMIGNFQSTTSDRAHYGELDEVRLAAGVPTADRVKADYDTVNSDAFLSAGTVKEFAELPKPVAAFSRLDTGAGFVQFGGSISVLGGEATAASVLVRAWSSGTAAPEIWTTLAGGLGVGDSFSGFLTGLSPLTEYTYEIKAVNDLAPPYDSDIATGTFTTSGVGDAGGGGTSERQLDEFVHTFVVNERGQTVYTFTPPTGVTKVDALVVAGGGPGGYYAGGGGGAGGLVYTNDLTVVPATDYTITVGTGGVAADSATAYGSNGGNSSIVGSGVSITATGGGAGGNGALNDQTAKRPGVAGGSGGGSAWTGYSAGEGTTGQGNAGGTVPNAGNTQNHAAGGGGAGAVGGSVENSNSSAQSSAPGGIGASYGISGVDTYYAGGGGGGGARHVSNSQGTISYGAPGAGGIGGGGKGGQETTTAGDEIPGAGTDGLGGGGGGGSTVEGHYAGGDGGSGIVIIRYGAGGDGAGVTAPTVSLTGLSYDDTTGDATVTYRVGWAGDGCDRVTVTARYGYSEDAVNQAAQSAVASDVIGQGSGSFALPRVSKTVYVRLVATNAGGYSGTSPEVRSVVLFNPAAPVAEMASAAPGVTRADFSASVTSLGEGASEVSGAFQVCSDRFFDAGTYTTFPITGTLSAAGTLTGSATGLRPNTVYWVRAALENDVPATYETAPVQFRTERSVGVYFLVY
ncbi:MAG: DUF2341 domain-containing protein, partial [Kiritimatiellae bacterium]|nr:DUF2341 domain-containing protein [Kiritimatiellia bacterium]